MEEISGNQQAINVSSVALITEMDLSERPLVIFEIIGWSGIVLKCMTS